MNQVERRPSAARTCSPVSVACESSAETTVTERTRPEGPFCVSRSAIGAESFSSFAAFAVSTSTGPQSWYGESVSYGSGTETRYGTAVPVASSADAVRPPEVEKKKVSATVPL